MASQPVGSPSARFPSSRCACAALNVSGKEERKEGGKKARSASGWTVSLPPWSSAFSTLQNLLSHVKMADIDTLAHLPPLCTLHHRAGMIAARVTTNYVPIFRPGQSNPTLEKAQESPEEKRLTSLVEWNMHRLPKAAAPRFLRGWPGLETFWRLGWGERERQKTWRSRLYQSPRLCFCFCPWPCLCYG